MIENEHVRRDFRRILEDQPDISDPKIISAWFFEAPHIFDPKPTKRLKPGIVIGLIYIALFALICAAFNFR
ncbi:MAG: hypothetical protein DMG11_25170 [Acidobacteria bacterium]|nr:MAG: hypothetical protein DMG11_25170 [Acidobacteriota bacterium]